MQETVLCHLMKSGVDMNIKDNEGLTPLDIAQKSKNEECVKILSLEFQGPETLNKEKDNEDLIAPENQERIQLLLPSEVQRPESQGEGEDNEDLIPPDTTRQLQDKSEAHVSQFMEAQEPAILSEKENSEDLNHPDVPQKRLRFLLEEQEPEITPHKEKGSDSLMFLDVTQKNNNEECTKLFSEIQTSEPTVSIICTCTRDLKTSLTECGN